MRNPRNIELALLLAAAPAVLVVFGLVDAATNSTLGWSSFLVPALLFAAFAGAHVAVRFLAPKADPGLLPITFALSGLGLAFVTRLDPKLAASQVVWLFAAIAALVVTLLAVPSLEKLAEYKYTIMIVAIVMLVLPVLPGIGREINGSRLWLRLGPIGFQPGEIAKILIVLFLAAYLADKREVLSVSTRRFLGMWLPPARALGPLLLMWAVSLFVLVFERDLGSSLLLFGIFLVMVYVATGRASYVVVGLLLFAAGATAAYFMFGHVQVRVNIWLHPFADAAGKGYQLVQSLFALGAGGLTGAGIGRGLPTRIPFVETDFIFSAIGEEIGLLGASAILIAYLVFALRGLATASRARSDMAAFTATGLVAAMIIQTFVIVGGVTRLIPLTGVTLPFVSYGGSSLLSSFIGLALLLRAGDDSTGTQVAMQTTSVGSWGDDGGVLGRLALRRRLIGIGFAVSILIAALITNLIYLQVVAAPALAANPANTRNLAEQLRQDRGSIVTADGTILAESVPAGRNVYTRRYPENEFLSHVVGYYSARYGRAGIEAAENDALAGRRRFASFSDAIDAWLGRPVQGNDVVLTVRDDVQKAAIKALEGYKGAVVVLDPRSGAVLASASSPAFDPNTIDKTGISADTKGAPLVDRTRSALYPPGSTFKVVTLTGALSNNVAMLDTMYPGPSKLDIGNAPVTNFEKGAYDSISLRDATAKSVNTVYGQVAVQLGAKNLVDQAQAFGFNSQPGYELPIKTSLMPDPKQMTTWETAWAGIGQPVGEHDSPAGPQATVMQMAEVAAGIANGGTVMRPFVVDRITDPTGVQLAQTPARRWTTATDPSTAAQVRDVMVYTVEQGSGARAQIDGVKVAGKTGTAEVGKNVDTNAWFIAFAPADKPTVAMAIMLEQGGVGGRVAAPRAKGVLEAALAAQGSR